MKIHQLLNWTAPLLMAVLSSGCRNDLTYQHEAVERAREYLCEEARELTAEQMMFVRQNPPVLMHGEILGDLKKFSMEIPITSEVRQICIVWRIPGAAKDYLVFGRSEPRMQFWRPERLLRRRLHKYTPISPAALYAARDFAVTSLREQISKSDLNIVRFRYPVTADVKLTITAAEKEPQTALIWYLDDGKRAVVILGKQDGTLKSWSVAGGGVVTVEELKKNWIKEVRTAKDFPFEDIKKEEKK